MSGAGAGNRGKFEGLQIRIPPHGGRSNERVRRDLFGSMQRLREEKGSSTAFLASPRGMMSPKHQQGALSPRNTGPLSPRRRASVSISTPLSPVRTTMASPMAMSPTHSTSLLFSPNGAAAFDTFLDGNGNVSATFDKNMDSSFRGLSLKCEDMEQPRTGKSNGSERRRVSMEIHALEQLIGNEALAPVGLDERRSTEPPVKLEPIEAKSPVTSSPLPASPLVPRSPAPFLGMCGSASMNREIRRKALRAKKLATGIAPAVKKSVTKKGSTAPVDCETVEEAKKNRRLLRNREAAMRSRKLAKEKMLKVEEELEEVYEQVEQLQETNQVLKKHLQLLSNTALGMQDSISPRRRQLLITQLESILRTTGSSSSCTPRR